MATTADLMPLGCARIATGERRRVRRTAREKFIMLRAQRVRRRRRREAVLAIRHPPAWCRELEGGRKGGGREEALIALPNNLSTRLPLRKTTRLVLAH